MAILIGVVEQTTLVGEGQNILATSIASFDSFAAIVETF
jgi:hypothetical protein